MPHDTNSVVASDATSTDIASSPSPMLTAPRIVVPDTDADVVAGDDIAQTRATQESERRSLAEVLIENARLVAQVEGKDAIITELKEKALFAIDVGASATLTNRSRTGSGTSKLTD